MNSSPLPGPERAARHTGAPDTSLRPVSGPALPGAEHPIATPPAAFTLVSAESEACADPRFDESLLAQAAEQGPLACVWQAARGLVVPRTYRRFDAFDTARRRFADEGWPVTVRQTGGGIVPQGPGIVNLSLAYPVEGPPMRHSEPGYRLICRLLADALSAMNVQAFPAAVEGSFCDGRYNLAVGGQEAAVKIAGTAQMWRRLRGTADRHVGLVHALVLVDVDGDHVTRVANGFEAAIGSERRYRPDRVTSLARWLGAARAVQPAFVRALERSVRGGGLNDRSRRDW